MPQRRYQARRRRRAYDDYDSSYPVRRRGGCLAPLRRAVQRAVTLFLLTVGVVLVFSLLLLIAFNFTLFVQLLIYALYIGAGLAVLGLLYLIVRVLTAISHRLSEASAARSQAKLERERVRMEQERVEQARIQVKKGAVQVRSQEAKLAREQAAGFGWEEGVDALPRPRRRGDVPLPSTRPMSQSPYRTRNLREAPQQPEPLVRLLPVLSLPPPSPEPAAPSEETDLERLGMPRKGQVFAYRDYQRYLRPGHVLHGIRRDGSPRIGTWDDLKIALVLGSSSSGKSTTVLEKCLAHVRNGGALVICDPGGFKPDSITQRLGPLRHALVPGTQVALEHEDVMGNVEDYRAELERRRRGADCSVPILLVVDELNGLLMDSAIKKALTELLAQFGQQARNYQMYLILCAQRASGLADIRNSMISYLCHKCPELEAAKILPARYAKLAPRLGVGQTFMADANGEIEALQQMLLTPEEIVEGMRGFRAPGLRPPSPQTEPLVPRRTGPSARPQTATPSPPPPPQQKLVLRRTTLVQPGQHDGAVTQPAQPPAPRAPQPSAPRRSPATASATWGEEQAMTPPPPPSSPASVPQQPAPAPGEVASNPPPGPVRPPAPARQDTFEMLALRRKKKT